jgi:hypothetical protein
MTRTRTSRGIEASSRSSASGGWCWRISSASSTFAPERGSAFPEQLDHYKVYRLVDVEQVPGKALKLQDQFGRDEVKLRLPLYLGVPVMKRHGRKSYPVRNDRAHLLIFSITTRELKKSIRLRNQFADNMGVRVVRSLMLAAPSIKRTWKQV